MHRCIRIVLAAALLATAAPQAIGAACVSGTFASYVALGATGCEIAGTLFSNFSVLPDVPTGATAIDPNSIILNPVVSATDPGLQFVLGVFAAAGEFFDSLFQFRVTAGATASLTGSQSALAGAAATGDGLVTLIQDMCLDGIFATPPLGCGGTAETLVLFVIESDGLTDSGLPFAPSAQFVDVVADFGIDGGPSGTATLDSATLRFGVATAVPEPSGLALTALALTLLASLPRTRRVRMSLPGRPQGEYRSAKVFQ